jgi:hypothetical protein
MGGDAICVNKDDGDQVPYVKIHAPHVIDRYSCSRRLSKLAFNTFI